ncbi:UNKNOWN [Stylonychia lemnae]|uniref:CUB domain-containing protein n=1 Tax=Stylonychia lemnae TaxID=5949 RepID=A0A078A405_STYLE|nr:UNKNOWN [Stylonychia lemnae]|eukprot:CDW76867.1 UNKNOWN [Stylonychia lemnae]
MSTTISKKSVMCMFLVLFAILMSQAQAIAGYDKCMNCFMKNRTGAFYCASSQQCLPTKSPQCPSNQIILKYTQCVEGFSACQNTTFTSFSINDESYQDFGLLPGYGCFIQIDRLKDGAVGTLKIIFDDTALKVYDDYNRNYQSGDQLNMPITENGWAARKVLVFNSGSDPLGFRAVYSQSIRLNYFISGIIGLLMLSINFII